MWCYKAFPQKGSCDYAMKRFVEYQFYILIPDIFDFIVFFFFFRKEELKRKPIKWHSRRKKPDRRSRCWTWGQMFKAWSFSSCLPGLCRHWLVTCCSSPQWSCQNRKSWQMRGLRGCWEVLVSPNHPIHSGKSKNWISSPVIWLRISCCRRNTEGQAVTLQSCLSNMNFAPLLKVL